MKPSNRDKENCKPMSSNCVIWQGNDIPCIELCKGDSVSDVVYKLATELCTILDQVDISVYDLNCLDTKGCAPADFSALIQLIIDKVCEQNGITSDGTSDGCPNCEVTMAPCFYYNNPTNGDQVTTSLLHNYVQLIGIKVCELVAQIATINAYVSDLNERVIALENAETPERALPNLNPVCILEPGIPVSLDDFVSALEVAYCELIGATGSITEIYQSVASQPPNLAQQPQLGPSPGIMATMDNWVIDPANVSQSIMNIWNSIKDLRAAVTYIQSNCCDSTCNDIEIGLSAILPNANTITLYLTGTIPSNFIACMVDGTTLFKIVDESGNFINVSFNLKANINNPSGYPVSIAGTPLNISDDFTITALVCFTDEETGTTCQFPLEYVLVNNLDCPSVTYTSGLTTIDYSFSHVSGSVTYYVQLFNSANEMIQSAAVAVSSATNVTGTFSGLTEGTSYKVRLQIVTASKTTTCPFTAVTTLPDACPEPNLVTAEITIP